MTINLHAVHDFQKGETGRVTGHRVSKVPDIHPEDRAGVTALQDIKAGTPGWFEETHKSV
jgi:hypothetical protein